MGPCESPYFLSRISLEENELVEMATNVSSRLLSKQG